MTIVSVTSLHPIYSIRSQIGDATLEQNKCDAGRIHSEYEADWHSTRLRDVTFCYNKYQLALIDPRDGTVL